MQYFPCLRLSNNLSEVITMVDSSLALRAVREHSSSLPFPKVCGAHGAWQRISHTKHCIVDTVDIIEHS